MINKEEFYLRTTGTKTPILSERERTHLAKAFEIVEELQFQILAEQEKEKEARDLTMQRHIKAAKTIWDNGSKIDSIKYLKYQAGMTLREAHEFTIKHFEKKS